jgi:hypothetical protein
MKGYRLRAPEIAIPLWCEQALKSAPSLPDGSTAWRADQRRHPAPININSPNVNRIEPMTAPLRAQIPRQSGR